jgi:glucose-6-phosphate 1-dehydrogenase
LFGAKGDLVLKTISPSLHALVKRGRLNVCLIAAARGDGSLEQRLATANESIKTHGGRVDQAAFARLSARGLR